MSEIITRHEVLTALANGEKVFEFEVNDEGHGWIPLINAIESVARDDGLVLRYRRKVEPRKEKVAVNRDTGLPIKGILEHVNVEYPVNSLRPDPSRPHHVLFGYTGTTAEVFWDEAKPVVRSGLLVFIDEEGNECLEHSIEFKEQEN